MIRKHSLAAIFLSILSVLGSFLFIFPGLMVATAETASSRDSFFALLTVGCGLINIAILSWAWQNGGPGSLQAVRFLATGFMVVFSVGAIGTGLLGGKQLGIIGVIAVVLLINWLAVRQLTVERRPPAIGAGAEKPSSRPKKSRQSR